MEITATGSIPQGLSEAEFFEGYSIPRNKELMRIFRDLDMVEYLGSGMPRILRTYPKECFRLSENFTRMVFPFTESEITPQVTGEVTGEVTEEVTEEVGRMLQVIKGDMSRVQIMTALDLRHEEHFRLAYLIPALEAGLIERTIPEKPNSRLQKYRLTAKGQSLINH